MCAGITRECGAYSVDCGMFRADSVRCCDRTERSEDIVGFGNDVSGKGFHGETSQERVGKRPQASRRLALHIYYNNELQDEQYQINRAIDNNLR